MQHAVCWFGQRASAHARQARRFCCCDEVVVTTSASSLVELQDDCCGERCTCICCSALQAFQKGGCEHSSKRLIPRCFLPNLGRCSLKFRVHTAAKGHALPVANMQNSRAHMRVLRMIV